MSWFPPRWRTQRSAISNTNRMFSWVVQFSNAPCTSLRKEVCLLECLLLFKQLCVKALIIVFLSSSLFVRKQGVLLCAFVCVCVFVLLEKNKRKTKERNTRKRQQRKEHDQENNQDVGSRSLSVGFKHAFSVLFEDRQAFFLERGDSCVCVLSFVCFLLPFLLFLFFLSFLSFLSS